jgi:hypothetical protein
MRLSEAQLAALRVFNDICRDRHTEAVIIGAVAFQAFYPNRDRYTRDIDLAVALDFEDFNPDASSAVSEGLEAGEAQGASLA